MPQLNPMNWFFFSLIPLFFYMNPSMNFMRLKKKNMVYVLVYNSMKWNW